MRPPAFRLPDCRFLLLVAVFSMGCGDPGIATDPGISDSVWSEGGLFEGLFSCDPAQPQTGNNVVMVELRDHAGVAIPGAELSVELWMPSMGHGCTCDPVESETGAGAYRIEKVNFTMPGSWELRLDVVVGGESDRIVAPVEVR